MSHGADCIKCGQCDCECYEIELANKAKKNVSKMTVYNLRLLREQIISSIEVLEKQHMNSAGFYAVDSLKKELSEIFGVL